MQSVGFLCLVTSPPVIPCNEELTKQKANPKFATVEYISVEYLISLALVFIHLVICDRIIISQCLYFVELRLNVVILCQILLIYCHSLTVTVLTAW